jgi:hypothetical protein
LDEVALRVEDEAEPADGEHEAGERIEEEVTTRSDRHQVAVRQGVLMKGTGDAECLLLLSVEVRQGEDSAG